MRAGDPGPGHERSVVRSKQQTRAVSQALAVSVRRSGLRNAYKPLVEIVDVTRHFAICGDPNAIALGLDQIRTDGGTK